MSNSGITIEAIVAVDSKYGIAKDGKIPWKSKTDMNFFKTTTTNNIIVMGSKTLLSLKNALPLPNRLNIVLTRNPNQFIDDPKYKDLDNILFLDEQMFDIFINDQNVLIKAEHYKYLNKNAKIFIIGGEQIYSKYCNICSQRSRPTSIPKAGSNVASFQHLEENSTRKQRFRV